MVESIQDALAALRAERSSVAAQLGALETRAAELDRAIASIDAVVDGPARGRRAGARASARDGRVQPRTGRRPRGAITSAILSYLETQGRGATHASEIMGHLEGQGVAPVGAHPKASLANTLIRLERQGKVRNIGRNRWRKVRRG